MDVAEHDRLFQVSTSRIGDASKESLLLPSAALVLKSSQSTTFPYPPRSVRRPGIRFVCDSPDRVLSDFPSHNGSISQGIDLNPLVRGSC